MDQQFVALERTLELALGHQALDHRFIHLRLVIRIDITATFFRTVERRIGVANKVDHVGRVFRIEGDAHAGCHEYFMALHEKRIRKAVEQAASQPVCFRPVLILGAEPGHDDSEFVTGEPADDRVVGQRGRESFGNGFQGRVAGQVPEGVIDFLEMVDVHIEKAQWLMRPARSRDRPLQQMLKLHAVRDLGQRIDPCEVAYALLGPAAFGDVLRCIDAVVRVATLALDDRARV